MLLVFTTGRAVVSRRSGAKLESGHRRPGAHVDGWGEEVRQVRRCDIGDVQVGRLIGEQAKACSDCSLAVASNVPGESQPRTEPPRIVVQHVRSPQKHRFAGRYLLAQRGPRPKYEICRRGAFDVEEIVHLVIAKARVDGQPRQHFPVILQEVTLIKLTINPLVGGFVVGRQVHRSSAL